MYTTIITLHKSGDSIRKISRTTKIDRKTVTKIIKRYQKDKIESPLPHSKISGVEEWKNQIIKLLESNLSYIRIFEELKAIGFSMSYSSLTRYLKKNKIKQNTCIRFHTDPGLESQVDFGYIGLRIDPDGVRRKAYIFNMRLSYSRLDYYEVVFDQKVNSWLQCHINAFLYFAGVPKVIKLDNLKSGILDSNFYEPIYQKQYKALADHYNFSPAPCRPYQPQEKGKVESGIKYVKNNFFAGRDFDDNKDLSKALLSWTETANNRIHGTTKEKPRELFNKEELKALSGLPAQDFDMSSLHKRKVQKDCHITLLNNYYSVPSKYVGLEVEVLLNDKLVKIYYSDENISTHTRSKSSGKFMTIESHYDEYKRLCPGFKEYDNKYKEAMHKIGSNGSLMLENLEKNHKYSWYRIARGIVSLRKDYSDDIIDKSLKRALYYGVTSYRKILDILLNNCYDLPLPESGGDHARSN